MRFQNTFPCAIIFTMYFNLSYSNNCENLSKADTSIENLISPNDYWSAVVAVSESTAPLLKKVTASSGNQIYQTGSWITPTSNGIMLLSTIMFSYGNKVALNKTYQDAVGTLIENLNKKLKTRQGQLFQFIYNSDEFGEIADIKSVRFKAMGFGNSPEQSLASGPIDQISAYYQESIAFPNRNIHYVWIFKDSNNKLVISTIKAPFIESFTQRATQLRINMLKDSFVYNSYTNGNISQFNNITLWTSQIAKYQNELSKENRQNNIDELNFKFANKQKEFEKLYSDYQRNLADKENLNNLFGIMNACESLVSSISKIGANAQANSTTNEKAGYMLVYNSLTEQTTKQNVELKSLKIEILQIDNDMRVFFKKNKLQSPSKIQLPTL